MASDLTNRLGGARSSLAFKAPVRCATTANITLSGFQTIDGITPAASDMNLRILVKDQTDQKTNGIYEMAAGAWARARDFDGNDDFIKGTRVYVANGSTNGDTAWVVTTADPITVGTSDLTFSAPTDEATTAAAEALASAAAAASSASAAATSASGAATSASAAATSASAASTSASAASTSATNAATSATNASNSASAAATSASGAATSASAASSSASAAATSAANAAAAAGFTWTFDSSTTMSAPSTGGIRFNHATLASVTAIAVHAQTADSGNPNVLARLTARGDSTNTDKGHILYRVGTSTWVEYKVTALTDNTTWVQFTVEHVGGAGSISNGNTLIDSFARSGDKGIDGGGSGDVTAASTFGTDNRLVRSDGTGKGVQASGITVDDSDVVSGVTRITASHATDYAARFVNTQDAASFLEVARFEGDRATPTDGDSMQIGYYLSNDAGTQIEAARMTWVLSDVTAGTEDSALLWMLQVGGSPEYFLRLEPTTLSPASNDLIALGSTSVGWADLHLATGGVINWANGEVTLTETDANTLTLAGATFVAPTIRGSSSVGGSISISATNAGSGTTDTLTLNASVYQLQSRGGAASYLTIDASGHLYVAGSSSFGTKDVLLGRTQGSAWMTTTNVVSTQGESASSVILNDNIYTSVEAAGTVDNTAVRGVGRAFGATESYTPNSGVTYVRGGEFHALMSDDAGTTGNVAWGVEIGVHNQRASLSRADGAVGVRIHSGNDGWFPSGVLRADAAIYVDGEAGFDYLYAFYDTDNTTLLAHVNYLGEAYFAGQVTSGRITATSTNAAAFAVGRQGSTNPVLQVDASASTVVTGLKVTGAAAAGGAALAVISSGTNEALTIDAKGSGTITLNGTGTGNVTTPRPLRTTDTTGSSSTSTGSLVASGGLGVGENIRAAGLISAAAASGYYLGTTVFAIQAGNYRAFYNGDGAGFMTIGNSVDESFYLDSNTIAFRTRGSLTSMGSITSSGWSSPGAIKSTSATSGIGYATGAGGTVTQATSKSTGVTLNAVCGEITMNNASLGVGTTVGFVLTNSAIAATDTVVVNIKSGATADSYLVNVTAVSAGSCRIELRNPTGGALAEAVVLSFSVIKAVTS